MIVDAAAAMMALASTMSHKSVGEEAASIWVVALGSEITNYKILQKTQMAWLLFRPELIKT